MIISRCIYFQPSSLLRCPIIICSVSSTCFCHCRIWAFPNLHHITRSSVHSFPSNSLSQIHLVGEFHTLRFSCRDIHWRTRYPYRLCYLYENLYRQTYEHPWVFIVTYLFRGLNCLCYFNAFCNNKGIPLFTFCQITTHCCSDIYQMHILFKNIRVNGAHNNYGFFIAPTHLRL